MNTSKSEARKLGTLVCFHPRYKLGIEHDYDEPIEFLRDLVESTVEPRAVVEAVLSNQVSSVRFQYDLDTKEWHIVTSEYWQSLYGDIIATFPEIQGHIPEIAKVLLRWMEQRDLYTLASTANVILSVCIPAVDDPCLQTEAHDAFWSTGQAGWIYATGDTVRKRYSGKTLDYELRHKVERLLQAEAEAIANPRRRRVRKPLA